MWLSFLRRWTPVQYKVVAVLANRRVTHKHTHTHKMVMQSYVCMSVLDAFIDAIIGMALVK